MPLSREVENMLGIGKSDTRNFESLCSGVRHVVAVPFPGQGHINPMMHLCKRLASKGAAISFVVTKEWVGFMSGQPIPPNVRLCPIPNVIPSELNRSADWTGFIEAVSTKMEEPFERLLVGLLETEERPVSVVIVDVFMPWAADVAERRGIPVAVLFPMASAIFSIYYHFDLLFSKGHFSGSSTVSQEEHVDYLPGVSLTRILDLPHVGGREEAQQRARCLQFFQQFQQVNFILIYSFYELESPTIDALHALLPRGHIFPVGPLIPLPQENEFKTNARPEVDCSSWLDSQPHGSTLYVSLGSLVTVPDRQMMELAFGLIESEIRFIWVARDPTRNLRDMCKDNGLVVTWCSQSKVLRHPSIGGFLTHCGWNSTMEAVLAGVPMLTFPINFDQPMNSKLVTDDWKVGLRVRSGPMGENELVGRGEIASLVRRLFDGEESKEMRRRIEKLKEAGLKTFERGGSSDISLNAFLESLDC
ncbi:UDP-glycosyltransferase 87A2 [Amborella trichopoda]|nr:UDP-glycosyltransferase 87A2 [Amborella trichopoda]|eukprot:XP_006838761.2 UDP-glycosyltransferase 87A2 [Amborella trichopoda]